MTTDLQLLERYATRQDRQALDGLMTRHYPAVYRVILKLVGRDADAADLAQSTFLRVLETRAACKGAFRAWVLSIAVNEVRRYWRREQRAPVTDPLFEEWVRTKDLDVADSASRVEFEQALAKALTTIPEELRVPLVLHYYEGMSLAEVGDTLQLSKSTAQSRCERAVDRLRRYFKRNGHAALLPLIPTYLPKVASRTAAVGIKLAAVLVVLVLTATWLIVPELLDAGGNEAGLGTTQAVTGASAASTDGERRSQRGATTDAKRRVAALSPAQTSVHSEGAGRIIGTFVKKAGAGVENAELVVSLSYHYRNDWVGSDDPRAFVNRYQSDASGGFVCHSLPTNRVYDLHLHADGFGYRVIKGIAFRRGQTTVDLGAILTTDGRQLRGLIVDGDGHAVAGAEVRIGDYRARPGLFDVSIPHATLRGGRVTTDAEGRFVCEDLSVGYHRLMVQKEGYALLAQRHVRVGDGAAELRLVLQRAASVAGAVVDDRGQPVAGASVAARLSEHGTVHGRSFVKMGHLSSTTTDAAGRFRFTGLPRMPRTGVFLDVVATGFEDKQVDVTLDQDIQVQLESKYRVGPGPHDVRGMLLGKGGVWTPIDKEGYSEVSLLGPEHKVVASTLVDRQTGTFALRGVSDGDYELVTRVAGYRPLRKKVTVVGALDLRQLQLDVGGVLFGVVSDMDTGTPIAGATVIGSDEHSVRTDASGYYEIGGFEGNGSYWYGALGVRAPSYGSTSPGLRLPKLGQRLRKDFQLRKSALAKAVHGRVVRRESARLRAVVGALVRMSIHDSGEVVSVSTRSRRDGTFTFDHLPTGAVAKDSRLWVMHPDYAWTTQPVAKDAVQQVIMEAGRRVTGRVVDLTGQPLVGALVVSIHRRRNSDKLPEAFELMADRIATVRTGPRGEFIMEHLPNRPLWMIPTLSTARIPSDANVPDYVLPASTHRTMRLTLERGQRLSGTVVDDRGVPQKGLLVFVSSVPGGDRTDAGGRFKFAAVFGQRVEVRVSDRFWSGKVEVIPGTGEARLQATRCGRIEGKLTQTKQSSKTPTIVTCQCSDGSEMKAKVHAGVFRFERVPVGNAKLTVGKEVLGRCEVHFKKTARGSW